jgi:hypothetical protein
MMFSNKIQVAKKIKLDPMAASNIDLTLNSYTSLEMNLGKAFYAIFNSVSVRTIV